jgi:hypothetical protein
MIPHPGNARGLLRWEYLPVSWTGHSRYDVSVSEHPFRSAEQTIDELVNDRGGQGWEMVSAYQSNASGFSRNFAWFKRPLMVASCESPNQDSPSVQTAGV